MAHKYLDPRNDVVFKRIFGEHPEILRSFLNALLPLPTDGQIVSLKYLQAEQVPELPLLKNSIVDVRCTDQVGRQFIVEMQMNWTNAFLQRVVFNASKAYVRQLERGERYELLQPVFGLSVLDAVFEPETAVYYHDYRIINCGDPSKIIEGLQLVFVELPKFQQALAIGQVSSEPLKRAWLRFLTETGDADTPEEESVLKAEIASEAPEIQQALELAQESAFTPQQLETYDRYWDAVRVERTLLEARTSEALARGLSEGLAKGLAKGLAEGRAAEREALRAKLLASGMTEEAARKLLE